jgi:hypothetical protein
MTRACLDAIGEHPPVMTVPFALENLARVVVALQAEKVGEMWVARLDLIARRPSMIREEVAAAAIFSSFLLSDSSTQAGA